jgi:hypothetical protein
MQHWAGFRSASWIRERGNPEWNNYLDSVTASPDAGGQAAGATEEQGSGSQALAGELTSSGGMEDCHDQQADVTIVDAGDGLAEADRDVVGEAGSESENSPFAVLSWGACRCPAR